MSPRSFFDLVVEMRKAQRVYFKTRETNDLIESKRLEELGDAEIDRAFKKLDERAAEEA